MTKLSLIIPCYNESQNLPLLIDRCKDLFSIEKNLQIIIVDNGSTDNTSEVLDDLILGLSFVQKVTVGLNKGYGNGILSGLEVANGEIFSWSHADMQTDICDVLAGLKIFDNESNMEDLFIKGNRKKRPIADNIFTIGMSAFETILLRKKMWDINAQPTMFHRSFYSKWNNPPNDFSLDLYAYFMAKKFKLRIKRFPVIFEKRAYGVSHWNIDLLSKFQFIKRTLIYSFKLQRRLDK
jgi:glycosyltransferase involved in cell wall biosynthesis